MFAVVQLKQQ